MHEIKTKIDVFDTICRAARLKNLGLFVGAGFSKAILDKDFDYLSYSWGELLKECCERLDVDAEIMKTNASYPEIASKICKQYSINKEISYDAALKKLREIIADLTYSFPSKDTQQKYYDCLDPLQIEWIVTTNYDTLLESVFGGKSYSISPDESFIKISNMIPIYHIHGVRTHSDSIVITNEDYAKLFRPSDYRQARLPFLIKESLVLMIGYGLGDINVLTAVDWSKNVYTAKNKNIDYEFPIIQLLYKSEPKDKPYKDDSGIYILEIDDIETFFAQLKARFEETQDEYNELLQKTNKYVDMFNLASEEDINRYISNQDQCRTDTLDFIATLSQEFFYIYNSFLNFVRIVIKEINSRSHSNGAFSYYDTKLCVILDILEHIHLEVMPQSFLYFLATQLDSVAPMIGKSMGQSWAAFDTWEERKSNIPQNTLNALNGIISHDMWNRYLDLKTLLSTIENK